MVQGKMKQEGDSETRKTEEKAEGGWRRKAKELCNDFVFETSVHGVKYIGAKDRAKLRRALWLLVVVGMTTWLVYTLQSLYGRYLQYPYFTSLTAVHHDRLPLPAISLCLRNPLHSSRLLRLPHGHSLMQLLYGNRELLQNATFREAMSQLTFAQLMEEASFGVNEVVQQTSVGMLGLSPLVNRAEVYSVFDSPLGVYGRPYRCFTFGANTNGLDNTSKTHEIDIYEEWRTYLSLHEQHVLPFDDASGIYLMIHPTWEIPVVDKSINIAPGSAVTILLRPRRLRFLPAPYRSMGDRDCMQTDDPNFRSPLRHFRHYSYLNCMYEMSITRTAETCNCTSMLLDGLQAPNCTVYQHYTCFKDILTMNIIDNTRETCKRECDMHEVKVRLASVVPFPDDKVVEGLRHYNLIDNDTRPQDLVRLVVKYESTQVENVEHKPELTMENIYSVVGGQMGLFLGASLLTVLELLEWLLCLLWSAVVHIRTGTTATRTQQPSPHRLKVFPTPTGH